MRKEAFNRLIILIVAILNMALVAFGFNPIEADEAELYNIASIAFAFLSSVWAWYKNNPTSPEGMAGTDLTRSLKQYRGKNGGEHESENDN